MGGGFATGLLPAAFPSPRRWQRFYDERQTAQAASPPVDGHRCGDTVMVTFPVLTSRTPWPCGDQPAGKRSACLNIGVDKRSSDAALRWRTAAGRRVAWRERWPGFYGQGLLARARQLPRGDSDWILSGDGTAATTASLPGWSSRLRPRPDPGQPGPPQQQAAGRSHPCSASGTAWRPSPDPAGLGPAANRNPRRAAVGAPQSLPALGVMAIAASAGRSDAVRAIELACASASCRCRTSRRGGHSKNLRHRGGKRSGGWAILKQPWPRPLRPTGLRRNRFRAIAQRIVLKWKTSSLTAFASFHTAGSRLGSPPSAALLIIGRRREWPRTGSLTDQAVPAATSSWAAAVMRWRGFAHLAAENGGGAWFWGVALARRGCSACRWSRRRHPGATLGRATSRPPGLQSVRAGADAPRWFPCAPPGGGLITTRTSSAIYRR